MKSKYRSKMIDSYKTKLRLFFFKQAFVETIDAYLQNDLARLSIDFEEFQIDHEIANLYAAIYYQSVPETVINYKNTSVSAKELTERLKMPFEGHDWYFNTSLMSDSNRSNLKKDESTSKYAVIYDTLLKGYEKRFHEIFPFAEFENMLKINSCTYCGINKEQIHQLGENGKLFNKRSDTRGYDLEIDRKVPNLEYSADNCCMSCYWCNNAKTDEYMPGEFKEIARGINHVWNLRFNQGTQFIVFPEKNFN